MRYLHSTVKFHLRKLDCALIGAKMPFRNCEIVLSFNLIKKFIAEVALRLRN